LALNLKEAFGGLEHLRLAICHSLFNMKHDAFLKRYAKISIPVEPSLDPDGKPLHCEQCGFVLIRVHFSSGWQMEMCSAMPIVDIESPALRNWLTTLAGSGDANDCQVRDFEPILHE